jgi:ribosomal protein L11
MSELIIIGGGATVELIKKRQKFVNEYCQKKKWNIDNLTMNQILEIRKQKDWKIPK